jgi:hypothetical protein
MALLEQIAKEMVAPPFQENFIANYLSWDRIAPCAACTLLRNTFDRISYLLISAS